MTHTRGYARNKEQDMPEGTEKGVGQFASWIASATACFGLISASGPSNCNAAARENSLFQRYSRNVSEQILSSHQQH